MRIILSTSRLFHGAGIKTWSKVHVAQSHRKRLVVVIFKHHMGHPGEQCWAQVPREFMVADLGDAACSQDQ